ncbi:unnamed protein product, partial [Amoebophrya sp. A120]
AVSAGAAAGSGPRPLGLASALSIGGGAGATASAAVPKEQHTALTVPKVEQIDVYHVSQVLEAAHSSFPPVAAQALQRFCDLSYQDNNGYANEHAITTWVYVMLRVLCMRSVRAALREL